MTKGKSGILKKDPLKIRQYAILILILWTIVLLLFVLWDKQNMEEEALNRAFVYTKVGFDKDILYRKWASEHGGVYVPITKKTPPNPYLSHIKNRDIITDSVQLTLVNPAYMTRQVYELQDAGSDIHGHITSLNPIRPENKADAWETKALLSFEKGVNDFYEVDTIKGKAYFRYMKPFVVETSCLKCHAQQGYKLNDIRGGISVSYPMESIKVLDINESNHFLTHFIVWFLGIIVIGTAYFRIHKSDFKRLVAEQKLHHFNKELEKEVAIRTKDLIESEHKWESVFRAIASPAQLIDKNHVIKYVNDATLEAFKCNKEDLIGKNCCAIFHQSDEYPQNCPLEKIKEDQKPVIEEIYLEALYKLYLISCTPLLDSEGNLDSIIHIMTDISEIKLVEENLIKERNKAQQYLEVAAVMMISIDKSGTVLLVNPKGCEILGYSKKEIIGSNWFDNYIPKHQRKEMKEVAQKAFAGEIEFVKHYENNILTKKGEERLIEWNNEVIKDSEGNISSVLSSGTDITARRIAEEELKKHREHLEVLVQKRTRELEEKNEKLDRINKLFVGRELRMAELKKEIEKLKGNT